jgi:hypothetical protein
VDIKKAAKANPAAFGQKRKRLTLAELLAATS